MPPSWTQQDHRYMARALQLAEQGLFTTDPNPRVGCVIVHNGEIVGEGLHWQAGEGHAEVNALRHAGAAAKGATAYVTLEPCSHYGKTGPCADALIAAGITRVVVAMNDPNPLVSGQGIARLEQAGLIVSSGLMAGQAEGLNPGFISRMARQRPYVRIKMAMSTDGRTAMASGESKWITGSAARADVQRLRARSSAIITGSGTVSHDDPSLNVRLGDMVSGIYPNRPVRQPLRVVLDRSGRLAGSEKVFLPPGKALYFGGSEPKVKAIPERIDVVRLSTDQLGDLEVILAELAERECNELLVEAGATLSGAFIAQDCWDELIIYQAPKLLGSLARPLFDLPFDSMKQARGLKLTEVRQIGEDLRLTYRPQLK